MSNIQLFRKLTPGLLKLSNASIDNFSLQYLDDDEMKIVELQDWNGQLTFGSIFEVRVHEKSEDWTPEEHNLEIRCTLNINDSSTFFGVERLTHFNNKLSLVCQIQSPSSSFQYSQIIGDINYPSTSLPINIGFPANTLRGMVMMNFFVYLKENNEEGNFQASKVGLYLHDTPLFSIRAYVDGDGSMFPMSEFEDPNGPLWKLTLNWIDASTEMFDISTVNLSLNTKHDLFKEIKKTTSRYAKRLLIDMMIHTLSMVIQQAVIVEENAIDSKDFIPGSILEVVDYWISTYEVDTTNIASVHNSIRQYFEREKL